MYRGGRRVAFPALGALLSLSACGRGDIPLPAHPELLNVAMMEYAFRYNPPSHAGRVVLDVRNAGHLRHDLALVQIPLGVPPLTYNPHSDRRLALPTLASLRPLSPGSEDRLAVDLAPGHYAIICFVRDADGVQHVFKGMHSEFRL